MFDSRLNDSRYRLGQNGLALVRLAAAVPLLLCLPQTAGGAAVNGKAADVDDHFGAAALQPVIKWDQPPEPAPAGNVYYGWNDPSLYGQVIGADDWYCTTADPVAAVRWWGSFVGWRESVPPPGTPLAFHLTIWSDVPAGVNEPFSHPGQVLWEWDCSDYTVSFAGWDYDPRTQTYESMFEFRCDIPQHAWFYQDPGANLYWMSIAATAFDPTCACNGDVDGSGMLDTADMAMLLSCLGSPPTGPCASADITCDGQIDMWDVSVLECQYAQPWSPDPTCCEQTAPPAQYPFGWKTRRYNPFSWPPDVAVRVYDPAAPHVGDFWQAGEPIYWPEPTPDNGWDFAFEIITKTPGIVDFKWDQPPVPNPDMPPCFYGWDDVSDYFNGPIVADDWACWDNRPVTDIHWWGSYLYWDQPVPPPIRPCCWHIGIWTDVPQGDPGNPYPFSHPGVLIWEWWAMYPEVMEQYVGCDFHPDWMYFPESCFYYSVILPESAWFYQQPTGDPTVYWVSIAAAYDGPIPPEQWGVKTRPRDPGSLAPDDAVRIYSPVAPSIGMLFDYGDPIWWPDPSQSWDIAFQLTTISYFESVKFSQPPLAYTPPDTFNGWNEPSLYGGPQIVADDWVCLTDLPVTDVHWWGSFLGWGEITPHHLPEAFHLAIWTDVPGDPSHPGRVIWEYTCHDYRWSFAGWDLDPRFPSLPPESCFLFECDLPQWAWFEQGPQETVFWLSIAAIEEPVTEYEWGWKMRPRVDALAPDDAVRIFAPTAPHAGDAFAQGEPIFWPTPEQSWDAAFRLTSRHATGLTEPKWRQPLYPQPMGFDAESNLWWQTEDVPKWFQGSDTASPGLHTDPTIELADDWLCEGGVVTDLHWYGNYELDDLGQEQRGAGVQAFALRIYADAGGFPGPVQWQTFVPFGALAEQWTGLYNSEGSPIYLYEYDVDPPFSQAAGSVYWFEVQMFPNPGPMPAWRWQEYGRNFPPRLNPAMTNIGLGWTPIGWPNETYSELAFAITSEDSPIDVNRDVADDFISDGRDILDVKWWGSYFDWRYEPEYPDAIHEVDGWLIAFHWADVNVVPEFPPDMLLDGHPTVLAVYFAPLGAVSIQPIDAVDCNGHALYEYTVDLDACCLLCSHRDPRNTFPQPGLPGNFQEYGGYRYWMSIQAVTGIEWLPWPCLASPTGHLPPLDTGGNGRFWGWHNGLEPLGLPAPTHAAATGGIVSFAAYPPDCWDYGAWSPQPWDCPFIPPGPVNMSFELWTRVCPEDIDQDGYIGIADLSALLTCYGLSAGQPLFDPYADFDNDGYVGLADLSSLLEWYGLTCP